MFTRQNPSPKTHKKLIAGVVIAVIAIVVASGAYIALGKNKSEAAPSKDKAIVSAPATKFTFNADTAQGWRKGPSNNTSLALFTNNQSCFTSIEYKPGTVNIDDAINKTQLSLAKNGNTSKPLAVVSATIATDEGKKQLDLHQYSVTSPTSQEKLYGGQEFGYLKLSKGYILAQGNCNTADELKTTLPALESVKFDSTI